MEIFNFENLKDYLRACIRQMPKRGWGVIQNWADHLGVRSSYVSQILSGSKSLNVDQALNLANLLGLSGIELDYFILLIEKDKNSGYKAKKYYEQKLIQKKQESLNLSKRIPNDAKMSEEQQRIFYSSWIYSGVRMFCTLDSGKTLTEIEKKFNISKEECLHILNFLTDSKLLKKDGNFFKQGIQKTHLDRDSAYIVHHWLNWHLKALSKFDRLKDNELIYSAPFSISEKDYDILREELTAFIKKFVDKVQNTNPEQIAFINIDFLKLF